MGGKHMHERERKSVCVAGAFKLGVLRGEKCREELQLRD